MGRIALALATIAAALPVAPADAAYDVRPTVVLWFGPVTVGWSQTMELDCELDEADFAFIAADMRSDRSSGQSYSMGGNNMTGARAQVVDQRQTLIPGETFGRARYRDSFELEAGERVRLVFAAWGGGADCELTLGGARKTLERLPRSAGAHLSDRGFDTTGASAGAFGLNAIAGGVYERQAQGRIWYFWAATAGVTTVVPPGGTPVVGAGVIFDTWQAGNVGTDGTWTFATPGVASSNLVVIVTPR